jgi:cobalt-zinc-cadmium efflux system outer membrane protein
MRFTTLALAAALTLSTTAARAQSSAASVALSPAERRLMLSEAVSLAESANPALRAKQAQLAAAEGASSDANALLQANPQLTLDGTHRNVSTNEGLDRRHEWSAGLSQTFEVAGQRGYRREAASQALQALRLEIDDLQRQQHAEVAQRFYRVLALQRRLELEAQATHSFDETARAIEQRRAAGEDTRLDANVALVEVERARNQQASIEDQLVQARSELAQPLQLPPSQLPVVAGELAPTPVGYTEASLLEQVRSTPRLQALAARDSSAQSRLQLARAGRYPDVTVGVSVGREGSFDARERLTTLSVSVPLPLFQHNASVIGSASTEASQAAIDRQAAERDLPAQIHAQWMRLENLRQRVDRLQRTVLPALAHNEELSQKSLNAGQISLLELILTNRQALDARRDLVDAQLDYQTIRLALEAAAGWLDRP